MTDQTHRVESRTIYRQLRAGQILGAEEVAVILELQKRTAADGGAQASSPLASHDLLQRTGNSDGVLAYLAPEGMEMRDFILSGDRSGAKLTGVGFFDTTTGLIHDLNFDYEIIDRLHAPTDLKTDRYLLETLIQERSNRYTMGLASKTDDRLIELYGSLGFEKQSVVGDAFLLGRPARAESLPTVGNATKHCDPVAPTDEYIIDQFIEIVSEGNGFEVDPRIAQLAFGQARELIDEAKEFGSSDTAVRDDVHDVLANFILGRDWPRNGEFTEEWTFENFIREIEAAHELKKQELEKVL